MNNFKQVPATFIPNLNKEEERKVNGFTIVRILGDGAQGQCFLATKSSTEYVLKRINIKNGKDIDTLEQLAINEVEVLKQLNHNNIVRFLGTPFKTNNNIYIVTQFYKDGDLLNYITKKGLLDQKTAIRFLDQLSDGLLHASEKGMIHRDIKLENIFIDNDTAVIGDFGLAIHESDEFAIGLGTKMYLPPEVVCSGKYTKAGDVWALGYTIYFAIFGHDPVKKYSLNPQGFYVSREIMPLNTKMLDCGKGLYFPSDKKLSEGFKDILRGMLTYEASSRWTLNRIMKELEDLSKYNSEQLDDDRILPIGGGVPLPADDFTTDIFNTVNLKDFASNHSSFDTQKMSKDTHPEQWLELQKQTCHLFIDVGNQMWVFSELPEVSPVASCLKLLVGFCVKLVNKRVDACRECLKTLSSKGAYPEANKNSLLFEEIHSQAENLRKKAHPLVKKNLSPQHHKRDLVIEILSEEFNIHDAKIPLYMGEALYFMFRFSRNVKALATADHPETPKHDWQQSTVKEWKKNMSYCSLVHLIERSEYKLQDDKKTLDDQMKELLVEGDSNISKAYDKAKKDILEWKLIHVGQ